MKLSFHVGETRDLERSLEAIVDAERRSLARGGLGRLAFDTLTVLALAAGRTEQIDVVVAWGEHGDVDASLRVRRGKFIEARDIRHHIAGYTAKHDCGSGPNPYG